MDSMVLATQKWLNKTYGSVPKYKSVPETGNTGWPTIYGLIRGMQHELGIALQDEAPAFGEATSAAFDKKVVPNLKNGYKSNFVYLIQGAFWAKGVNPEEFTGVYSAHTDLAVKALQKDAGIPANGILDSQLAQALFDMSAFVLVSGGDNNVRQMQQYLNANYRQYTGILPADGIYQRATNTALIYGVQVELGLGNVANGFWGPTTIATYKSAFANGLGGKITRLVQYALYVNMKEYLATKGTTGPTITGTLDGTTQNILSQFQSFMMLDPVQKGQPDSTTMYSLMLSSGNPARNFFGMDTSYQLDSSMIKALVAYEVNYVGRYLTGTVGSGATKRNKNLTLNEAQNIIKAGLKLVPIYQDNNPDVSYFNYDQGFKDARLAVDAALTIGIPNGNTIYFAVDIDMTDEEITAAAIPYFQGITEGISHYNIGVYGTRNASSRVSQAVPAVLYSYVSNMSTGFSGNLGFSQPTNWAFDQFFEDGVGVGPLPALDRVAVSNIDKGVTSLVKAAIPKSRWFEDTQWQGVKDGVTSLKMTWNSGERKLVDTETIKVSVSMDSTIQQTTSLSDIPMTFEIKNGKIAPDFTQHYESISSLNFGTVVQANIDKLSAGIKSGSVTVFVRPGNIMEDELPMSPVISLVFSPDSIGINNNEYTIDWAITFKMQFNTSPLVKEPAFETVQEQNWDEIRQKWANGFKVAAFLVAFYSH
ncbi:glycoside hydrolase domain-containing protein [uncultured Leuconostoc sp.]|uniref:glycoside hydrolase domain-containing protein n=1 Tax=uncultured Leuconostoc sp. TaxID=173262 RepID=UPI0026009BEE|nr:glycoside hydrolase domain-containing protein [uncultured Leuconostoc sp.]